MLSIYPETVVPRKRVQSYADFFIYANFFTATFLYVVQHIQLNNPYIKDLNHT